MRYQFPNTGVCSSQVAFDLNDGIVTNVKFTGRLQWATPRVSPSSPRACPSTF